MLQMAASVKNNGNCHLPKVVAVAVAYMRWSFTSGSNCKALTEKCLVLWTGGRYGRWSQMEIRRYTYSYCFA